MLSSIICRKSPDDNDKDGLSEVIVLKRTEILTHCLRICDIDKDGAQIPKCSGLWNNQISQIWRDEVQALNKIKPSWGCVVGLRERLWKTKNIQFLVLQRGSLFFRLIFTGAAQRAMDISWSFQRERGKQWVLVERGGIFMRRQRVGGNFGGKHRWSETGWELTAGTHHGYQGKELPVGWFTVEKYYNVLEV